jgi:hypothetical protein
MRKVSRASEAQYDVTGAGSLFGADPGGFVFWVEWRNYKR